MPSHTFRLSNPTSPSPFLSSLLSQTAAAALVSKVLMPSFLEDNRRNETRPFIPRTLSYSKWYQQQRRRHVSSGATRFVLSASHGQSFPQGVRRAASDTYVLTTWLRFKLFQYLGWKLRFLLFLYCHSGNALKFYDSTLRMLLCLFCRMGVYADFKEQSFYILKNCLHKKFETFFLLEGTMSPHASGFL